MYKNVLNQVDLKHKATLYMTKRILKYVRQEKLLFNFPYGLFKNVSPIPLRDLPDLFRVLIIRLNSTFIENLSYTRNCQAPGE